jgi:hypothetical protein
MASNNQRWVRNLNGATEPFIFLALFQAGATEAIKRGELLEFTGDTNTAFVPIDSDFSMNSNIAIANEEIKSGDRAGYYEVIVPRPGDVFEFDLAVAAATAYGAAMYFSSSEAMAASGSNVIGRSVGQTHYPLKQGHLTDDAAGDSGTTIGSISKVQMVILEAASLWSLWQS